MADAALVENDVERSRAFGLTNNVINGVFLEDAIILKLAI